tara:strand:- start:152 stop:490 length:339 start_codon:yes stop_codon:yes gene_type:complete
MKNEILEAIKDLQVNISDIDNGQELYEELDYDGRMHEIIDGNIDIYYHDLREWAVKNWDWVEEANSEGLGTNGADYHKDIQAGQFMELSEKAYLLVDEIFEELKTEEYETNN